jgi:hypothetical protein
VSISGVFEKMSREEREGGEGKISFRFSSRSSRDQSRFCFDFP